MNKQMKKNRGPVQARVVGLLQTAIRDIERGDRIDALDTIGFVVSMIRATLPPGPGNLFAQRPSHKIGAPQSRAMIKGFEASHQHVSPSGTTACVIVHHCLANNISFTLEYQAEINAFRVLRGIPLTTLEKL